MKAFYLLFFLIAVLCLPLSAQEQLQVDQPERGIAGFHIGVVQPMIARQNGETRFVNESGFYAIGFPMGITFHTTGKPLFDMEFVPFIKPHAETSLPYEVNLLFHPGILMPLGDGFTLGLRAAFELGQGQFGFTPLLNKSFNIGRNTAMFFELVAPARFGPEKNSGYTQVLALHVGFGF